LAVLGIGLVMAGLGGWFAIDNHYGRVLGERANGRILKGPFAFSFDNPFYDAPWIKNIMVVEREVDDDIDESGIIVTTMDGSVKEQAVSGVAENAFLFDLDQRLPPELVLERSEGQLARTTFLYFDEALDDMVVIPFVDKEGRRKKEACCLPVRFVSPHFGDGYDMVIGEYRYTDDWVSIIGKEETQYEYDWQRHEFREVSSEYIVYELDG
jgi:hypothetical protein